MLRCVSITPFGSPVVPEVNITSASVPPVTAGSEADGVAGSASVSNSTVGTSNSRSTAASARVANARRGSVCPTTRPAKSREQFTSSGTTTAPA